jgi:RND family efflux transporter MFP subunit
MSVRRRIFFGVLAAAVALAALAAFAALNRPPAAPVAAVERERTEQVLAVVGRVRPIDRIDVLPINPGQVIRLFHDEGDRVAAGAPLAIIKAEVEQAQTAADLARVEAARARAVEARRQLARTASLYEKGFAAAAALDQARAELRTAEAEVAAAAATARASAEREREFIVRAPADSVVLARPIDTGQVVSAATTLFELGAGAGGEIEAEVDEAYGDAVRPGMAARISPTGAQAVSQARVTEVSPRVDPSTGGRLVRLRYGAGADLVPGRSVDVTIVVRAAEPLILVPRTAVVDATVSPKVYVVGEDDRVAVRPVRIADWPSTAAIVQSGLAPGERLVLTPDKVEPGGRVRPIPAP